MTLEESLRRDLQLVTIALGIVERIPALPTEPLRDPVKANWPTLGRQAQAYQDFLMGTPAGDGKHCPGAWARLSPILSSFRIEQGCTELELIHASLVHVSGWENTAGHTTARRRLIDLLERVVAHLRRRLEVECGVEPVIRRGQRGSRRMRTITSRKDLDAFQQKAMELLAAQKAGVPVKGSAVAAHCGATLGTSKRSLSELVRAGCLTSSRGGYVFVRWPGDSEREP